MPELMELMENWSGFRTLRGDARPEGYETRLKETIDLLTNAKGYAPYIHEFMMREALTTSDFPYLFGDVLDRQVLASYRAVDPVWKAIVRMNTVPRIFPQIGGKRFAITGGDQVLAEVAEKGEYLASDRDERRFDVYVKKYGRQFDISWEAIVNDDLGALQDTPKRFAMAAARTEHRLVTGLYVADMIADTTHAAGNLYDDDVAGEVNLGALPLTIQNLEDTVEAMMAFTDVNGEPIQNRPKYLVVGPALEFTARQILTSTNKMWLSTADDESATTPWPTTNVISQFGLQLIVDPYIPVFGAQVPGSWFLFADPNDIAAIEFDHLVGHETPEICMKNSDKVSIGGGPIGPMDGDFATDNILYRVRLIAGANKLEWRATYAQSHA